MAVPSLSGGSDCRRHGPTHANSDELNLERSGQPTDRIEGSWSAYPRPVAGFLHPQRHVAGVEENREQRGQKGNIVADNIYRLTRIFCQASD